MIVSQLALEVVESLHRPSGCLPGTAGAAVTTTEAMKTAHTTHGSSAQPSSTSVT
ncbi:hypothetical protein ACFWWM_16265 [Streptomyces sp. NPDC058682]|uniref:hypothetical protein n=1 Tax=Streptomyces sp. NPDC058682 TaxID=3346596 RepID=UPI0036618189